MQRISGVQIYRECVKRVTFIEDINKNGIFMRKSNWNFKRRTDILKLTRRKAYQDFFECIPTTRRRTKVRRRYIRRRYISMSITAETAKAHANDPAVLCCRAEGGITIEAANLEDPAIFDELVDSGLLNLDGCLTIGQVLGAKLTKTSDSLCPLTVDNVEGFKEAAEEEAADEAEEDAVPALAAEMNVQGAVATVKSGKVIISIKEGRDIYLELPV